MVDVRKGQAPPHLSRQDFSDRFRASFGDPAFDTELDAIDRLEAIAWAAYQDGRKAPRTTPAGSGFADPRYQVSVEWLQARERLQRAQARWADAKSPSRVLVICGGSRNDGTCPGEMSKTFRLARLVEQTLQDDGLQVDMLDLSLLTSSTGAISIHARAASPPACPFATGHAAAIPTIR